MGYVRGRRGAGVECDRPLQVVCRRCDYETVWACAGHRESRCKPCADRYRRRVRRVAESGTGRPEGFEYFLTLTAIGTRVHSLPGGRRCECTSPATALSTDERMARWNASHSARWNHFRTALRREYPALEFFRGVEVQGRGALHDHAMIWSPRPLRRSVVKELAMRAGFGHSVDLVEVRPGSKRAAYYVSKYITKATDSRSAVPWWGQVIDYRTGEVTEDLVAGRYRTWSMSRQWGLTMAAVRAEAREWARAKRDAEFGERLLALLGAFPGAEALLVADESPPPNSA